KADIDPGLVVTVAVVFFAIVDLWVRPRDKDHGTELVRGWMPLWALAPFLLALTMSVWVHYLQWQRGLVDIHELAVELNDVSALRAHGEITSETADDAAHEVARRHFSAAPANDDSADQNLPDEKRRFLELARVVAHDLARLDSERKQ